MEKVAIEKNYFDEIYSKLISSELPNFDKQNILSNCKSFEALNHRFKNHFCLESYADKLFLSNGDMNLEFFKKLKMLASSNISLIITGGLDVEAKNNNFCEKNAKIVFENLSELRSSGVKIFLTLTTTRGRNTSIENDKFCLSASLSRKIKQLNEFAFPVFDNIIKTLANLIVDCVSFAKNAGFDGIVVDCSLLNLFGELFSKEFNRRKLGYFSGNGDFIKELSIGLNKKIKDFPILLKVTPLSFLKDCFSQDKLLSLSGVKFFDEDKELFSHLASLINSGIDGLIFSFGTIENEFLSDYSANLGRNLYFEFYENLFMAFQRARIKNKFNEEPLLIFNDNFSSFNLKISNDKYMYEISKEIFSDLNFIRKVSCGDVINHCIRCGLCKKYSDEKNQLVCTINPLLNEPLNLGHDKKIKNIAVIGCGTSGIISAIVLAKRGYQVTIFEKENKINQNGRLCEVFGFDKLLKSFNDNIEKELFLLEEEKKIILNLNCEFKSNNEINFDAIVVATGFRELFLGVPGAVLKSVVSIFDILSEKISYKDKKHIVVYAKSELALKLALFLAENKYNITILIPNHEFLDELPQNLFSYYLIVYKKLKVKLIIDCEVKKINDDSVELYCNYKTRNLSPLSILYNLRGKKQYKFQPEAKMIDCNLFIYDADLAENNRLFYDIVKQGYLGEIYMVGDSLKTSNLYHEIHSAYFVGNNI